jgi:hypothetical protein
VSATWYTNPAYKNVGWASRLSIIGFHQRTLKLERLSPFPRAPKKSSVPSAPPSVSSVNPARTFPFFILPFNFRLPDRIRRGGPKNATSPGAASEGAGGDRNLEIRRRIGSFWRPSGPPQMGRDQIPRLAPWAKGRCHSEATPLWSRHRRAVVLVVSCADLFEGSWSPTSRAISRGFFKVRGGDNRSRVILLVWGSSRAPHSSVQHHFFICAILPHFDHRKNGAGHFQG